MQCVIITYKEENLIKHKWETVPTITKLGQQGKTDRHTYSVIQTYPNPLRYSNIPQPTTSLQWAKVVGVSYYIMLEKWGE